MVDEVTTLKKNLLTEMRLLKGDNDVGVKKFAYINIVSLVNQIKKLDDNFTFDDTELNKYSAFRPDNMPESMKKVKWISEETPYNDLETRYKYYIKTAMSIVQKRFPAIDTDSDKFGLIVNATTANLIQVDLVDALKNN